MCYTVTTFNKMRIRPKESATVNSNKRIRPKESATVNSSTTKEDKTRAIGVMLTLNFPPVS